MIGHDNIDYATLTDVGVRRSHNQDSYAALPATDAEQWQHRGHIFLVADGMGAHAVGELASKLAADSIPHIYSKYAKDGALAALRKAFVETNITIHSRGQQNREFEGMGTTGTALLLRPEGAWVGHVGDSRAYRVRDNHIEQLSFDHSLVWELARRQRVNPDELQGIPSNVIVRSLGPEPLVQVDVEGPHAVRAGDIFVLCSDGLSGPLTDREIGAVVSVLPPKEACRFLIDLANLHGGPDNITALVVRVTEDFTGSGPDGVFMKPRWYTRLPWPLLCLILGILFALGSYALAYFELPGSLAVFLLGALTLLGGLAALMFQYRSEKEESESPTAPRQLKVYRKTECGIELPLVQKLAKAQTVLEGRLRDHNLSSDWETYRRHQEEAQKHLNEGKLADSFRGYCRAMLVLTETFQKQRNKEEVFQPVWDKTQR